MSKIVKSSVDLFHGFNLSDELKSTYEEWFSQFQCKLTLRLRRQLIFLTATNLFSYYRDDGTLRFVPRPFFSYLSIFRDEELPFLDNTDPDQSERYVLDAYKHWIYINRKEIGIPNSGISSQAEAPTIPNPIVRNYGSLYFREESGASYFYYSYTRRFITHDSLYREYPLLAFDFVDWLDRNDMLHSIDEFITFVDCFLSHKRTIRMYMIRISPDSLQGEAWSHLLFKAFLAATISEYHQFSMYQVPIASKFWSEVQSYIHLSSPPAPDKYDCSRNMKLAYDIFINSPFPNSY